MHAKMQPAALPEVDLSVLSTGASGLAAVAAQVKHATNHSGFFYLAGHGVSHDIIERVIRAGKVFFAADDNVKRGIAIDQHNRGYLAPGEAQMFGAARKDLKEVFFFGRELDADDPDLLAGVPLCAPNKWPQEVPELRRAVLDYCLKITNVGHALLSALAVSLDREADYFARFYRRPLLRGQLIHYPAPKDQAPQDQFGVAPHSDFGCLTLLYQHTPGLEVKLRDGTWLAVDPRADRLVVNIGDLLERWTAGKLPSTRHRVRNQTGASRYALAIFFDPSANAVIDPHDLDPELKANPTLSSRYAPVTAAEYILGRSKGVFAQFNV